MKAEGSVLSGGAAGGDVKVGKIRFELRPKPTFESPVRRNRQLEPEQLEEVERRKAAKVPNRRVQNHDYDRRAAQPSTTPPKTVEKIIEMYVSGVAAKDVATEVGVAKATVLRYLREAGVQIRGSRKQVDVNLLIADYEAGMSLRAVADRHGVSNTTVRYRLIDAGVQIRSQGSWRAMRREGVVGAPREDD